MCDPRASCWLASIAGIDHGKGRGAASGARCGGNRRPGQGMGEAFPADGHGRHGDARKASAIQIEDQRAPKRCGHFDGKELIPLEEMVGKVRAAVDTRRPSNGWKGLGWPQASGAWPATPVAV